MFFMRLFISYIINRAAIIWILRALPGELEYLMFDSVRRVSMQVLASGYKHPLLSAPDPSFAAVKSSQSPESSFPDGEQTS